MAKALGIGRKRWEVAIYVGETGKESFLYALLVQVREMGNRPY
jgi:hypothetical protein